MIAKSWLSSCWQWKIGAGVAIVGTLFVRVNSVVLAQIVPDNTLGAESSVVTPNVNIRGIESDRIDNGAIRGANLFHSFEEFNVGAGRGAYFTNPAGIENIFSRVTGANRSEIMGRLGVLGNANLFLINPRGIVFGPAASLDVQGSFLATTADAVKLGDAGLFSAAQPATSNLLTVSPSAILFNTIAAQPIINRSRARSLIRQPNSAGLPPGLQVQPGRTLALIGGNVLIEGGRLTAAGGRIELGSVAGVGQVSVTSSGNRFVLGYDLINDFGNILLSDEAFVDASGEGGGDIQVQGARLEMTQGSNVWADTLGAENGGEVLVRTTEVVLSESSLLSANVAPTGTGTGGNLTIDTGRLLARDGARVTAITEGNGKSGNLQINADDSVEAIGRSADNQFLTGLYAQSEGSGDAGNLTIDTRHLLMQGGARVSTVTFGAGKGGSLQITADDAVELIGTSADSQFFTGLFAQSRGSGDAGNLTIDTGRLLVRNGARVSASALDVGKGGNLHITADDAVELIGESANGQYLSGLYAQSNGNGDAGNLTIDTGRLLVQGGAQVSAATFGAGKGGNLQITADDLVEGSGRSADGRFGSLLTAQSQGSGDAGSLMIDTRHLLLRDGAQVSTVTFGAGKGGSLQIIADDAVELIDTSADNQFFTGLFAQSRGSGDAGNLTIDTGHLLVRDGAQVSTITRGTGKGGSLHITADDSVELIGTSADGQFSPLLAAQSRGSGDAGNLTIDTGHLLVQGGAQVSASAFGVGKGGSLQITASEGVDVIGTSADGQFPTSLAAQSRGSGDAGNLTIDTGHLLVQGGAQVSASAFGVGKGGSLQINASEGVDVIGTSADGQFPTSLAAQSRGSGDAGNLTIDTGHLLVQGGAQVSTSTLGAGKGGSLHITADDAVDVIGTSADGQFSTLLSAQSQGSGDAGNLTIDTRRLLVQGGAKVSARALDVGKGGSLQINASEGVDVISTSADHGQRLSGLFASSEASGDAGSLTIDTRRLLLQGGAQVSAATFGAGKGGSLQITASDSVELIGISADGQFPTGLFASSQASGDAGNLTIDTGRLLVRDGAAISSASRGEGTAGNINIRARDTLQADDGTISTNTSRSSGGAIAIKAGDIRLFGDSDIISNVASGADDGGAITLTANSILAFDDSDILAFARDGTGGDIALNTPAFFGENYRPAPDNTNPDILERNNRVDINATGAVSGIITIPDVSFIQNSLTELPENQINTDNLLATSCIVRRNQQPRGSFTVTGTGGLPQRPGNTQMSSFPTVDVATLPSDGISTTNPHRSWQKGDPIVEPQGVYRLANGKLVLSRECS